MTKQEIIQRLRDAMKASGELDVNWDDVTESTAINSLVDSLSILDLIFEIQQEFEIEFDAEEMIGVDTVGDLADFLAKRIQ